MMRMEIKQGMREILMETAQSDRIYTYTYDANGNLTRYEYDADADGTADEIYYFHL